MGQHPRWMLEWRSGRSFPAEVCQQTRVESCGREKPAPTCSRTPFTARKFFLTLFVCTGLSSTIVTAGGPVAPEFTSFAPLDQDDLVDHFTGGFRYNVPLMEVPGPKGGYPIALTYASGITPDQDASCAAH
jgi:hypothetical protein